MKDVKPIERREYKPVLSVSINTKGVLDVDTVKGCSMGMAAHKAGGCYGLCYACKMATFYGMDFARSISRQPMDCDVRAIEDAVTVHPSKWFRIGTMGDPSHDWPLTLYVCEWLGRIKTPVIVTKHWRDIPAQIARRLAAVGAIINTSISALDTDEERDHRLGQHYRLKGCGLKSILRVVTAAFGKTDAGVYLSHVQRWLMIHGPIIDTPLRIPANERRVLDGTILTERVRDMNGLATVSRWSSGVYLGKCQGCPDQCGATI